jgi:uncharacterized membrane protein (UPF0127 family)
MHARFAAIFTAFLLVAGCAADAGAAKPLPHAALAIDTADGLAKFEVEVAGDQQSQEQGLMFRKTLAANAGMLFDFHQPVMTDFWMKNTILPLDIIFIRPNGTISTIHANATPYSTTPIPAAEPVRAVLEINGGRAKALGILPGARVHEAIFGDR